MDVNPVVLILRKCGVGIRQFERDYDFAHETMINTTQGMFEDLSQRMLSSLHAVANEHNVDLRSLMYEEYGEYSIINAYAMWRGAERDKAKSLFDDPIIEVSTVYSPAHFFVRSTAGSPSQFARVLKVPPATVMRWITGVAKKMPKAIEAALEDVDFPRIEELKGVQEMWVEAHGE